MIITHSYSDNLLFEKKSNAYRHIRLSWLIFKSFYSVYALTEVFLNQIISCQQKNANAKLVLSISCRQKWNSYWQFSKNCIFPNIHLKGVVNRLPPFKNLSDHTNKFLMG